jgi:putative chitinase
MLTELQLRQIMPTLAATRAEALLPFLNGAMAAYAVNSPARTAAFVAQLAHESGEFRWMEEIWGPTTQQKRYEPPGELAVRLGNTEPGDGLRFKGRGPIQITGRSNYRRFGQQLGIDLVARPELVATPAVAFEVAALFWKSNGLNELADAGDFVRITKRINGGTNGLAQREKYFAVARAVLAEGFDPGPSAVVPRGARNAEAATLEPLSRGHEAVRARPSRLALARRGASAGY